MKNLKTFLLAVIAGIAIGIGGTIYLTLDMYSSISVLFKVLGALFFAVGLYAICIHGLNLFTGKIGYVFDQKNYLDLVLIWIGNFIGTWICAFLINHTRLYVVENITKMCETKMNDSLVSLLILGFFCGLLMFIAVDGYKKCKNPLILFICVATFILCGFEHCIADMFYFSLADAWCLTSFIDILIITLGNALGAFLIPITKKIG